MLDLVTIAIGAVVGAVVTVSSAGVYNWVKSKTAKAEAAVIKAAPTSAAAVQQAIAAATGLSGAISSTTSHVEALKADLAAILAKL